MSCIFEPGKKIKRHRRLLISRFPFVFFVKLRMDEVRKLYSPRQLHDTLTERENWSVRRSKNPIVVLHHVEPSSIGNGVKVVQNTFICKSIVVTKTNTTFELALLEWNWCGHWLKQHRSDHPELFMDLCLILHLVISQRQGCCINGSIPLNGMAQIFR